MSKETLDFGAIRDSKDEIGNYVFMLHNMAKDGIYEFPLKSSFYPGVP